MESGVTFPLLAGVQLLAVAAALGLVAVSFAPRLRDRRSTPLVAAGGTALAAAEVLTTVLFGGGSDDRIMLLRAVGYALVAAGLLLRSGPPVAAAAPAYGVVAPLGARAPVAALAALAAAVAAGAAVRRSRAPHDVLVAVGLLLGGAAAAVGSQATDGATGPSQALLALRGASAVALVAAVVLLARSSVLGKVAVTTIAGVLVMAVTAVSVTGLVLIPQFDRQQAQSLTAVGQGQENARGALEDEALTLAGLAARCGGQEPDRLGDCASGLAQVNPGVGTFVAFLTEAGGPVLSRPDPALSASLLAAGRGLGAATVAQEGGRFGTLQPLAITDDQGTVRQTVTALGVAAGVDSSGRPVPGLVAVYGIPLTDAYAEAVAGATDYDLTLLVGGEVVASSLPADERDDVTSAVRLAGLDPATLDAATVTAEGDVPGINVRPLGEQDPFGLAVLSVPASEALRTQRTTLQALVLATLGVLLAAAAAALLLGRQVAEPVRRLTLATRRVEAGELVADTGVRTRDEVGVLARSFESMTGSLSRLTADLRTAAVQEGELRGRLETVLASMSDGLVAAGRDGLISSANPAAASLLGVDDPGALVGRRLAEVVDLRDTGGRSLPLRVTREEAVADLRRVDGAAVAVRYAITPLVSEGGGAPGLVVVLRDTTREREVERMKTEFLSNVSHELRTPLTPIHAYSDMLLRRPDLPVEKRTDFARAIHEGSTRMKRVVDLLVDAAALEAGRVTVQPRPTSVADLVDRELDLWRTRVPDRADDLRRRVAAGLPPVLIDPAWVGKALDELVDNALKYSEPGTPVLLAAGLTADRRSVRLAVRDHGRGIAEEARGHLFSSFSQGDGSATREIGGLGLGLSFVQRLADEAGLPLTWESAEGRGSVFALDLPVTAPAPAVEEAPVDARLPRAAAAVRSASRAARPRAGARGPGR